MREIKIMGINGREILNPSYREMNEYFGYMMNGERRLAKHADLLRYIDISQDSNGWNVVYSVDLPKHPIVFCGMMVDLEDGMCYFGTEEGSEAPVLARINEVMSEFFGEDLSVEAALVAVEAIRLSGNTQRSFETAHNAVKQSLIGKSIAGTQQSWLNYKNGASDLMRWVMGVSMDLCAVALTSSLTDDQKAEVNRTLVASGIMHVVQAKRELFTLIESTGLSSGEGMMVTSCKKFYGTNSSKNDYKSKASWLAVSALELANSLEGGNDVVLCSDVKKRYVQLGFDKVVTPREVTSLVRAKDVIKEQRSSVDIVADTAENPGSFRWGIDKSGVKIMRNSLKQVAKIVNKILKVKEGK